MPSQVNIDFETRNTADIKCGASKYADTAIVLCLAYSIDGGPVKTWRPGQPEPKDLLDAVIGGATVVAWNAAFERQIWKKVCVRQWGWPEVAKWKCTMAAALACGLPGSLEMAAKALGLNVEKDMAGRRLMLKMSKPRKPTKKDPSVWHDKPEDYVKLLAYCAQDVRTEMAVGEVVHDLSPTEQGVYEYDHKVNARGVKFDIPLVENCIKVWNKYVKSLNDEMQEITFGGATTSEVARILGIAQSVGVPIGVLDKRAVANALGAEGFSPTARRMLELRQLAAKSSVAKFKRILQCAEEDGRIRGCTQYHGARTGRFAGRLIQLQNLPRGVIKEGAIESVVDAIMRLDVAGIEQFGQIGDVLASMVRSSIIADKGKKLIACDFSSVEARGTAWVAGETWLLDAFRKGECAYKHMASKVYNMPYDAIGKDSTERFYGKQLVLGCIAEGTPVLTESGWKPIETITMEDRVWDGVEFVKHQGLLDKGTKETLNLFGSWLTPDHPILCGAEWRESITVSQEISIQSLALATGADALRSLGIYLGQDAELKHLLSSVVAVKQNSRLTDATSGIFEQPDVIYVQQRHPTESSITNTTLQWRTTTTEYDCLTGLHRQSVDATSQQTNSINTTADAGLQCARNGGKTELSSSYTSKQLTGGTIQNLKWTETTTVEGMSPVTFGSCQDAIICSTEEPSKQCKQESTNLRRKSRVYDLLFCGPRNRFVILTQSGPLVVHNCGYQLGGAGFQRYLDQYNVKAELKFCNDLVAIFRKSNKEIVKLWYSLERAAVETVRSGRPSRVGRIVYHKKGRWLCCRLPSGRDIRYLDPKLVPGKFDKEQIEFTGIDITGKPVREMTYGGKLTENCIQGLCRDLLVWAMSRLEKAGYPVVFHVHDEVVVETEKGTAEEVERIMTEIPDWAEGFPIGAEGFECQRYRK